MDGEEDGWRRWKEGWAEVKGWIRGGMENKEGGRDTHQATCLAHVLGQRRTTAALEAMGRASTASLLQRALFLSPALILTRLCRVSSTPYPLKVSYRAKVENLLAKQVSAQPR